MKVQDLRASPLVNGANAISARIVASWNAFATRWNPVVVIVVAWAVLTWPLLIWRGFHGDEGLAVTAARSALEDGHWITPYLYNTRFVERPTLLSWMIAAVSSPFGSVSQFTARLPVIVFLLAGCWLIFALLRRVSASVPAALLGALLFLACPIVQRAYALATADMVLAVLLFIAFIVWWDGYHAGRISIGRWSAIGGVLALAGLMKGPQPVAYFALGIGLFILITRSWRQLPGFILAGVICVIPIAAWYGYVYSPGDEGNWAAFMRFKPAAPLSNPVEAIFHLFSETMPAALLAIAFFVSIRLYGSERLQPGFLKATLCYGLAATVAVLFWPGGSTTRYFFPLIPPMCVLAGLGYDAFMKKEPLAVLPGLATGFGILVYAFVYSDIATPLLPRLSRSAQLDAARIAEMVKAVPAPIFRSEDTGLNVFALVPGRIRSENLDALKSIPAPAWIAVQPKWAQALIAARPNKLRVVMQFGQDEEWQLLRLDK